MFGSGRHGEFPSTKSLTTGEAQAHLAELYGVEVSRQTPKIRDGKAANRSIYLALAVTAEVTREVSGLWAGDGGDGAKFWRQVLTELWRVTLTRRRPALG
ncbi:transposase [Micromonospora sp. NPDC006766]|uniref:transposase n=1 Tax=Micromonospora sp. NPDC006766 TaxID=3154778 RepID=UPI0033C73288